MCSISSIIIIPGTKTSIILHYRTRDWSQSDKVSFHSRHHWMTWCVQLPPVCQSRINVSFVWVSWLSRSAAETLTSVGVYLCCCSVQLCEAIITSSYIHSDTHIRPRSCECASLTNTHLHTHPGSLWAVGINEVVPVWRCQGWNQWGHDTNCPVRQRRVCTP